MRARLAVPLALTFCVVAPPGLRAQMGCERAFMPAVDSVRQMVTELGLPGAGLIIRLKGRTVCEAYVGPIGSATEMPVVSAAKWLSAAAILVLVDQGKLKLDDSVSHYLPYFKGDKRGITVRQLLSHTSGLPDYAPCMFQQELTLEDCARQIGENVKLRAPPGAEFAYGGAAFTVAGRVAEIAAQATWAEIFSATIATPLGLRHTGYGSTANPLLSEGLTYSSAGDYATFLQMLLDGGVHDGRRILSESALDEMTRDQTVGVTGRFAPGGVTDRTYGLGCWRGAVDSVTGRALLVTSPGGGGFVPWLNRRRGIVGVLAVYDRLERVWPTALAVMTAARDGAVALDSAVTGTH